MVPIRKRKRAAQDDPPPGCRGDARGEAAGRRKERPMSNASLDAGSPPGTPCLLTVRAFAAVASILARLRICVQRGRPPGEVEALARELAALVARLEQIRDGLWLQGYERQFLREGAPGGPEAGA